MYTGLDTYCGLSCAECEFREEFQCGGCVASQGHPFYGECELAHCAKKHRVNFCGECKDFCCELLHRYSFDEKEGDEPKGARIERCRQAKAMLVQKAKIGTDPQGICGMHCEYCFQSQWCGGCRSSYACCSYRTLFPDGQCQNIVCSRENGLDGCYDCENLMACEKGYFSHRFEFVAKASAIFIQRYGKECFQETMEKALAAGVEYPKTFNSAGSLRAAVDILEQFRVQDDLF